MRSASLVPPGSRVGMHGDAARAQRLRDAIGDRGLARAFDAFERDESRRHHLCVLFPLQACEIARDRGIVLFERRGEHVRAVADTGGDEEDVAGLERMRHGFDGFA